MPTTEVSAILGESVAAIKRLPVFIARAVELRGVYDAILLPTDGSDAATAAVANAIDLATQYDATLHVLYVADTTEYSTVTFEDDVVDPSNRRASASSTTSSRRRKPGTSRHSVS